MSKPAEIPVTLLLSAGINLNQQKFHLTLQTKALILIAVPLAFEVVLLLSLYWLYYQEKEVLERAQHVKSYITRIDITVRDLYEVGYSFVAYNAKVCKPFEEKYYRDVDIAKKRLKELKTLFHRNQSHMSTLVLVDKKLKDALSSLELKKGEIEAGENFNVMDGMNMRNKLNSMVEDLRSISLSEDNSLKKIQERLSQLNSLIPALIVSGVVASIVLALVLAAMFQQSTSRRLKMLMINIANLGKHQELRPVLTGNDEIARIDLVFHTMADELNQAEKQKQEFVDMVSHDLRTPLSAVQTSLAILGTGAWGDLNEKGKSKVSAAENNIRRSISLLNNLLDFERMQSGKLEIKIKDVELIEVLEICAESVSQLAEQRNIRITLQDTKALVQADADRISQVVLNLLGNAIKFSHEDGDVVVSVLDTPPFTQVRVQDNGPGIPEAHRSLIFNRFHQAPGDEVAKAKGTGLGLAICRLIIDAHGGDIGVESEEGKGSTFWFTVRTALIAES